MRTTPTHPRLLIGEPLAPLTDAELLADGAMNTAGACEFLGRISERKLRGLVARGLIRVVQDGPGCRVAYPKRELVAYLAARLGRAKERA